MAILRISCRLLAAKSKRTPREASEIEASCARARALSGRRVRDLFVPVIVGRRGAARPVIVCACGVVLAAARGVGESVVCIVDGLEALCAGCALGRVGGDAVRVVLQGGFFVGIANLLLGRFGVDVEDLVVVLRCWAMSVRCRCVNGEEEYPWWAVRARFAGERIQYRERAS